MSCVITNSCVLHHFYDSKIEFPSEISVFEFIKLTVVDRNHKNNGPRLC